MCPLNRPINLDEGLAAPSQIFPSAYFLSCVPLLFPLSLPHILGWKSLVIIVVAGSLVVYTAEWRNIYSMGYGDDLAQFVSLWRGMTFPFPSWLTEREQAFSDTQKRTCRCVYTHEKKNTYINTVYSGIVVVTKGCSIPASKEQCVLWGSVFG